MLTHLHFVEPSETVPYLREQQKTAQQIFLYFLSLFLCVLLGAWFFGHLPLKGLFPAGLALGVAWGVWIWQPGSRSASIGLAGSLAVAGLSLMPWLGPIAVGLIWSLGAISILALRESTASGIYGISTFLFVMLGAFSTVLPGGPYLAPPEAYWLVGFWAVFMSSCTGLAAWFTKNQEAALYYRLVADRQLAQLNLHVEMLEDLKNGQYVEGASQTVFSPFLQAIQQRLAEVAQKEVFIASQAKGSEPIMPQFWMQTLPQLASEFLTQIGDTLKMGEGVLLTASHQYPQDKSLALAGSSQDQPHFDWSAYREVIEQMGRSRRRPFILQLSEEEVQYYLLIVPLYLGEMLEGVLMWVIERAWRDYEQAYLVQKAREIGPVLKVLREQMVKEQLLKDAQRELRELRRKEKELQGFSAKSSAEEASILPHPQIHSKTKHRKSKSQAARETNINGEEATLSGANEMTLEGNNTFYQPSENGVELIN